MCSWPGGKGMAHRQSQWVSLSVAFTRGDTPVPCLLAAAHEGHGDAAELHDGTGVR